MKVESIALMGSFIFILFILSSLQFLNPYLYEVDGYYHIKVPNLIHESGVHYKFPWAKFSTFNKCYADKEFLFHLLLVPFTFFSKNIHTQARMGVIFFASILLVTFILAQKRFTLKPLLILSLISLPTSILCLSYLNYLRPKTLTISLLILLLYCLIEKKWICVFILSILYPLTHISFPMGIVLAFGIEIFRYLYNKEFFFRNPLYTALGMAIGIFLHPNFPNNLLSLHLNAILVPWNNMFGDLRLNYGVEWNPAPTRIVILDFPILFIGLFFFVTILLTKRVNLQFHTIGFFFATSFFSSLSMFSNCYWYFTYPIGLIFLSMFFSDYLRDKSKWVRIIFICITGSILIWRTYEIKRHDIIANEFTGHIDRNGHYERMAYWMDKLIPPGEIIYHTSWSDSPYFICLNPKDYYLTMLDPIYMYYYNKDIYNLYNNLSCGFTKTPVKFLRRIFKSKFVYTGRNYGLYKQLKTHKNVKLLVEDEYGAIFKLLVTKDEK